MSYYSEHNGLAKYWEFKDIQSSVSHYERYHPEELYYRPEMFEELVNRMKYYEYVLSELDDDIHMEPLTPEEIDEITQ